ncbi:MAG: cysteine desulfurase [Oscillospiraceae bacterium]|nr:cysteine desulfurase [Oscillospiraceae bacterium]
MIYLDNSATTKPCAAAVAAMTDALERCWGNPSALHAGGIEAAHMLKAARKAVAEKLGAEEDRVFFTSGGTEADNWAIFSTAERLGKRGKHIVTTAIEHHAVLHPIKKLELSGFEVTYLQPDADGTVTVEALRAALRKDTILVSIMMVNNEGGSVMPIKDMIRTVRRLSPNALFHTDAVQGFLKVPFAAKTLGADLISISSHKIHGPKGCGALYIRKGLTLPPYLHGGGQEQNYRSGTEAMPAIAGFGAACAAADPKAEIAAMREVRDYGREILQTVPGLVLNGSQEAPHVISLALPGVRSQGIINCLQDKGIYVSAGSACAKGHRSHVLEAMGLPPAVIDGSVRASLSAENTKADMDALRDALLYAQKTLKG